VGKLCWNGIGGGVRVLGVGVDRASE
jgi:hypothetical protein